MRTITTEVNIKKCIESVPRRTTTTTPMMRAPSTGLALEIASRWAVAKAKAHCEAFAEAFALANVEATALANAEAKAFAEAFAKAIAEAKAHCKARADEIDVAEALIMLKDAC